MQSMVRQEEGCSRYPGNMGQQVQTGAGRLQGTPADPEPSTPRHSWGGPEVQGIRHTALGFAEDRPEASTGSIKGFNPIRGENTEDTGPGEPGFTRRGGLAAEQAEYLAARIEDYREYHSLTQSEFAKLAGFSRNTVNNIEAGRGASKAVRKKLARLFGVSPAGLLNPRMYWRGPENIEEALSV